jgi:1-acyl-sn-glycerol-3-phosphate acyltransferase
MKKIQDDSTYYNIIYIIVKFAFRFFFRQIEVRGSENIPENEPVIFAPNHQSGLMDPLVLLFNQRKPIVFMARADIFNSKSDKFLNSLKIMPVYRIRDGYENLSKNEEQFNVTRDVLIDYKQLCVMPEGNHGHQHKLRPLVKGIFRIAFSAEEAMNDNMHVKIIPVSIDYNFFQHAGADIVIKYGEPISIGNYIELYRENQANALNLLKNKLAYTLSEMMHDIRSTDNYDLIYHLCCYGTPAYIESQKANGTEQESKTRAGKNFDARKAIGLKLDKLDQSGSSLIEDWRKLCKKLDKLPGYPSEVTDWMESKQNILTTSVELITTAILMPGLLMNAPSLIVNSKICSLDKDKQMHNTYAFVCGIAFNPLIYLITTIILAVIFGYGFIKAFLLLLFLGCLGIVAERWRQHMRIPFRRFFYSFGKRRKLVRECKKDYQILKASFKKEFYM